MFFRVLLVGFSLFGPGAARAPLKRAKLGYVKVNYILLYIIYYIILDNLIYYSNGSLLPTYLLTYLLIYLPTYISG